MIAYLVTGPALVFAEVVLVACAWWGADDGGVSEGVGRWGFGCLSCGFLARCRR
jgi:hypothetical protein